jgi:hypothetical protein
MRPDCIISPGRPVRWALLALLLWPTLTTPALAHQPPVSRPAQAPVASSQARGLCGAATRGNATCPAVHGAVLGDRQRMVQVAMIFMGVAILILTRGNKF